ncbi:MAG: hypothetical protein EAZ84_07595 [Verrucomicrobia bacterium]|nr:MAG: hypothetical protein EAZ84_07595 [Verrucomicrobiota bacterium]TAE88695.1 MAG: hypothetical protein EAZ82_03055 [Verrucomicrobiota bacterium]TAF26497.1 MAG: hypothetical protein EAZ71_04580 [Verrucomicrobiota bacterium]
MRSLILMILIAVAPTIHAESRNWQNKTGTKSFAGEYVSHDAREVTIRRSDGRVFTLEIEQLHTKDRTWLSKQAERANPAGEALPDPSAVFDTLCFGDTRAAVMKKLGESKMVESSVAPTFLGRTGLNGTYRTRKQIGGLHCELYFDWTDSDTLAEVTLQTQALPSSDYSTRLEKNWTELTELLTLLHGEALQAANFPKLSELQDDLFLGSHLWRLENGGSALLGTSMQAGKCMVVVRFTRERIQPVRTP